MCHRAERAQGPQHKLFVDFLILKQNPAQTLKGTAFRSCIAYMPMPAWQDQAKASHCLGHPADGPCLSVFVLLGRGFRAEGLGLMDHAFQSLCFWAKGLRFRVS